MGYHISDHFCVFPFIPLSIHSVCSFLILFHCSMSLPLFVFSDVEHLCFFLLFFSLTWLSVHCLPTTFATNVISNHHRIILCQFLKFGCVTLALLLFRYWIDTERLT